MAKKIGLLMILLVLMASLPVFAADTTPPPPASIETISLDKCLELALKNSKQVQQAAENVTIAQEAVQEANGAFWPSLGYRYTYVKDVVTPSMDLSAIHDPKDPMLVPILSNVFSGLENEMSGVGYSGYLSLTQPLYTGGKLTNSLKLAQLNLNSAQEDQRKAKEQLGYSVKEAYYNYWLAEKMLATAEDSDNNLGLHYQRVTNLFKAGTASSFDLLYAKVQWENQKPQVIKAQNSVALARINLANLIGREPNQDFKVEYDPSNLKLPENLDVTEQAIIDEAYRQRPEMHQMNQVKEIAKVNEQLAKAGYLPSVSVSCNYSMSGGNNIFLNNSANSLTLSANVSGPIFDGFTTKARISKAEDNLNLAQLREDSLKDQIRQETEMTLQNLETSLETVQAIQASIELAQESIKQTQTRFAAGVATTTDITDAQLVLEQTYNGYYQGIASYLIGLAKLDQIAGRDVN